ncbi:phosphoglycerate mutase-like protein [Mycena sanguinolenta]|nr:phosphoglycerate mutase-like protein [Mycena sanguinolenta]
MSRIRATFTFVRHGESVDNLRAVWAGWADATLTNHGIKQAQAVGASLSATQFTAIYSSPLKRSCMTAEAIQQKQVGLPPLVTTPLLREQNFGIAEGKPSTAKRIPDIPLAEQFDRGLYPRALNRSEKFPEGESLDDVQDRAKRCWAEVLLPYVQEKAREDNDHPIHVAVISHGVFIKEALRALAKYDRSADFSACDYQFLRNTAWARAVVEMKTFPKGEDRVFSPNDLLLERIQLTHFNQYEHLATVTRQKGGIGREAHDIRQKDIRGFFGDKPGRGRSKGL